MSLWPLAQVLIACAGLVPLLIVGYLLTVTVAAALDRPFTASGPARMSLTVLVPAHNEEELIERCLASLQAQEYPRDLVRIVVIADNCTDRTAVLAATAGAEVLERREPDSRGKGQALRWAVDRVSASGQQPDAWVVVDADSVADIRLLAELEGRLRAGARAAQAEYLVLRDPEPSAAVELAAAAFMLFHRVRFAGLHALGLSVALVGNGMAFDRRLLSEHPWDAFTGVEDLEYATHLRERGIRVEYVGRARIYGPMPTGGSAAQRQRLRWEGGRFDVVRRRLPALIASGLRRRDWSIIASAVDLAVPPLAALVAVATAGLTLGVVLAWSRPSLFPSVLPWALAVVGLAVYVPAGLVIARAPASTWKALLGAPAFVARKLLVYVRLAAGLGPKTWERTLRGSDRIHVNGIPIDRVDAAAALQRLESLLVGSHPRAVQACTVNLDFLVNARLDRGVREILRASALNVADGAPILWLARLLGLPLAERVAGADLVPRLVGIAAVHSVPVYFLGGGQGIAAAAARELSARYPSLVVAGVSGPERVLVGSRECDRLVADINRSGAGLLLVGLGHPKQETLIAHYQDCLQVRLAIGVGCCFDLLAGKVKRAPRRLQLAGLEWLWRLAHEPGRLTARYCRDAGFLFFVFMPGALRQRWLG